MYKINKKHPMVKLFNALPSVTELTLDTGHVIPTTWFEDTISDKRYEELLIAMGNKGLAVSDFYVWVPEPPKDLFDENYRRVMEHLQNGKHVLLWFEKVDGLMAVYLHEDGVFIYTENGERVITEKNIITFLNIDRYAKVKIFEITEPEMFFKKGYQCAYVPNHMQITPREGMGISKFRLTGTLSEEDMKRYCEQYDITSVVSFNILDKEHTLKILKDTEDECKIELE